jgi:myo-inositol-1(or 4)-monophosphatase
MTTEAKFVLLKTELQSLSHTAREYFESDDFSNEQKTDGSNVTAVDEAVEKSIRSFITKHFPDDSIVGEEEESVEGSSGYIWHVDPIDGTDNFLRKIPFCAISVARLGDSDDETFAIVHNPITNLTFSSFCGASTCENEHLTNLAAEPLGGRFTVSISSRSDGTAMAKAKYNLIAGFAEAFGRCCAYGSCALEMAYVSAGRIDAFLTFGLSSWDYAAGAYLIRAAGGVISVYENGEWKEWTGTIKELCSTETRTILVSHRDVHQKVVDFVGELESWATSKVD